MPAMDTIKTPPGDRTRLILTLMPVLIAFSVVDGARGTLNVVPASDVLAKSRLISPLCTQGHNE